MYTFKIKFVSGKLNVIVNLYIIINKLTNI